MLLLVVLENSSHLRRTEYFAEVMNRLRAGQPFLSFGKIARASSLRCSQFPHHSVHRERVAVVGGLIACYRTLTEGV